MDASMEKAVEVFQSHPYCCACLAFCNLFENSQTKIDDDGIGHCLVGEDTSVVRTTTTQKTRTGRVHHEIMILLALLRAHATGRRFKISQSPCIGR